MSRFEYVARGAGTGAMLGLLFGSTSGILVGLVAAPRGHKLATTGRLMRRNGLWFSVIFGVATGFRSFNA